MNVPPPGVERGDLPLDPRGVRRPLNRHDPLRVAVERDHADVILGRKQVDRRHRRGFDEFDLLPAHRSGAVDHEREGGGVLLLLIGGLHLDGEQLFDGRAVVPADAKAVPPADHHEPPAELLDVVTHDPHLIGRHLRRGKVGEDHAIEPRQFLKRRRDTGRITRDQSDIFPIHRFDKIAGLFGFTFDIENHRPATDIHERERLVVRGHGVGGEPLDADSVTVQVTLTRGCG